MARQLPVSTIYMPQKLNLLKRLLFTSCERLDIHLVEARNAADGKKIPEIKELSTELEKLHTGLERGAAVQ
jgi:hypothetical protein